MHIFITIRSSELFLQVNPDPENPKLPPRRNFNKRRDRDFTVSSKISNQIDNTCSKLRSSSLGQPMSASLLDLQNKSFNINDLVTNSVNIVKGISSSGI